MATQKDVAKLAGVSFITVSRVVNNQKNVRPETRQRVEAAIKELNYYPNSIAQGLNRNRTKTIALLAPLPNKESIESNSYYRRLLVGIEHSCLAHGYDMLVSAQRSGGASFDFLRPYYERKADGLIFMGAKPSPEQIEKIAVDSIPCVVLGDRVEHPVINYVDSENYECACIVTQELIDLGHRYIAFVDGERPVQNIEDRRAGFLDTMEKNGMHLPKELVYYSNFTKASGTKAWEYFSQLHRRPTGVICATDLLAMGVMEGAKLLGTAIPEQLSVVGFDGHEIGPYLDPPLASVWQPVESMGEKAADALFATIHDKEGPRLHLVEKNKFLRRGTIAAPPLQ